MSRKDAEGRILAAARDLFLEFGVASVTTDKLAKAAKTSKMTLYKYFASKEELLEAVVEKEVAKIFEPSKMEVTNQFEYQNMLKHFCVNLVNILFDPQIVRFDQLMISQALSSKTMSQDHYKRRYLPAIKELVRLITMGQEQKYLKTTQNPADIADMVLSSISGLSYTKALFGFDVSEVNLEEKIANVLDILFSADDTHKQSKV